MKAAIYARYSSDLQRDASIEDQVRLCTARIVAEGWAPVATYTDHGVSGASSLRPGYQKLLEDARTGAFEVVVAEALDRLSRDQEHIAALYKQLGFAGVRLVTLAEGEVSELHIGLKGTMNALFLKDLAQKTRRGLEGRVRQGRSGGGLCYGYNVVREVDAAGNPIAGGRCINPAEAAVVRRVFREYAAGRSPRAIALDLNADGIAAPSGRGWGQSTLNGSAQRGTGILNNELYVGRLVWNRLRYIKDPSTGKRVSRLNPESQWVVQDVPELRIVDQELWNAAKERQASLAHGASRHNTPRPFWDQRRSRYLLSGLVKCGTCGGGYAMISNILLGCSTARNKGTCDNRLNVRRDTLETTILHGLQQHLMDPVLFKEFAEAFYEEVNRLRSQRSATQDAKRQELARIEQRIRRIVDAIADGAQARALKDELLALEDRQMALHTALRNAPEPAPLIHPNLAEIYRRKVAALHEALEDTETRTEAFEAIRSLISAIVLTPVKGELKIDLQGDIAHILTLASANKKPAALSDGLIEQVKLVAGARNHLDLLFNASRLA